MGTDVARGRAVDGDCAAGRGVGSQRGGVTEDLGRGVEIPPAQVLVNLAAGGHPGRHPRPETLDITPPNSNSDHPAFGHGIHHCLDAPLATLEATIAASALITRFPRIRPARDPSEVRWAQETCCCED
jgi:cytochrome P450